MAAAVKEAISSNPTAQLDAALNLQRKAAIIAGGAVDHAGKRPAWSRWKTSTCRRRFSAVSRARFRGWSCRTSSRGKRCGVTQRQRRSRPPTATSAKQSPAPDVNPDLIDFMHEECDFSMEHADGTFLEHLLFCHDYAARHYADYLTQCGAAALDPRHGDEHVRNAGGEVRRV